MTEGRAQRIVPEMWPSLAISVIWLVVLVAALFGPDIVASNAGTSFTRIPVAVVLAFFAWLATWVIARHCFSRDVRRSSQSSQSTPVSDR